MRPNESGPDAPTAGPVGEQSGTNRGDPGNPSATSHESLRLLLLLATALSATDRQPDGGHDGTTVPPDGGDQATTDTQPSDLDAVVRAVRSLAQRGDARGHRLQPLRPRAAVAQYLDHRRDDTRRATRRKHASALHRFIEWTDAAELDNLNTLTGRHLIQFKAWRKTHTEINTVSLNGNLAILRTFLRFCETIEAVPEGLADRVPLPNVPPEAEISDTTPSDTAVAQMRSYYRKFEYASRRHAQFELIAEVGLRLGAIRAIDLDDVEHDAQVIHLRHRPEGPDEYGTPLKNGADGERIINLSPDLCDLLADYIEHTRDDVRDQYGRQPLLTTAHGRVARATIRRDFYKMTRPCISTGECPHGREIAACPATSDSQAVECPSRFSTHPLRRWSIMHQLDAGVPKELLSDRVDVSVPVLDKHYDQRSEARKSRQRRDVLETALDVYANQ